MKRKSLLVLLLGLFYGMGTVSAQSPSKDRLIIGFELGLPLGDFSNFYDVGTGISLNYQNSIHETTYITGSIGFIRFSGKSQIGSAKLSYKADFVPVKIGLRHYFVSNIYGTAEMGAAISTGTRSNGVAFAYSPGAGIELPMGNRSKLDIGLRYESWLKDGGSSFIGFRSALLFNL